MISNAAKVGVFVVLALAVLTGVYVFLEGSFLRPAMTEIKADFDNAQGITKGTMVRMAGVKIGEVIDVKLDPVTKRAVVTMRIEEKHRPTGHDQITIATGGLLPAPYIEIIPEQRPGQRFTGAFHGTSPATVDQLMAQGQELVKNMNQLTQSFQKVVGDPKLMADLKSALASTAAAAKRGERVAANLEAVSQRAPRLMASFEHAGRSAEGTMTQAQAALTENRTKIARLMDQSSHAMDEIAKTLVETRHLIADPETQENLKGTLANIREASGNLRDAAANLRQTSSDVQNLTGDPKVQNDLRATISGARGTMEEAQRLLQRVNHIIGSSGEKTAGARQRLRDTDLQLDVHQVTSPGRPGVDVNATLPGAGGHFTRLGLQDFGENTKLNFQFGRPVGDRMAVRYGLHASRLGAGLDWGPAGLVGVRPRFSVDLYGLDEPSLDVRLAAPIHRDTELTFGFDRLFRSNAPVIGVRWHK